MDDCSMGKLEVLTAEKIAKTFKPDFEAGD